MAQFQRLARCTLALIAIGALWLVPMESRAQAYGLSARQPIGPYLDGRLPATAPSAATGWTVVPAFPNLTFRDPTFLTFEPNTDRLYVGTLWGRIYRFVNNPATSTATLFLDLSGRTQVSDNSGLLGMAFHPEFGQAGSPNRGYIYVFYQYSPNPVYGYRPSYNRLSRFRVPDGAAAADPASELVLIDQYDPHVWHNGGGVFFGPDGFLYVSVGAAGGTNDSFNAGQRLDFGLFSGVLRIDVDQNPARSHPIRRQPQSHDPASPSFSGNYYIPNDNPFLDPAGGILEEFWAIGLRSPHRMTYDPIARQIWVGDVGQNGAEEVNVIVKGGNYQWAYREGVGSGPKARPATVLGIEQPPIYHYAPGDANNSVIGGYVYRGREHAALLDGLYIFGDNGSGRIWALQAGGGTAPSVMYLCNMPPGDALSGLSSFGIDRNSELYMCKMGPEGRIYKLARAQTTERDPPALLSQTAIFSDLRTLTPAPAFIPYRVNAELWSDGALKHRWIAVPNDGVPYGGAEAVAFSARGAWSFPAGTVFVKHFELPIDETNPSLTKRLETRLLVRDAQGTVYGLTYKWRADGSDADLLPGSLNEEITIRTATGTRRQTWFYPSRQACMACHTAGSQYVLGVNTRQLNGTATYPSGVTDNQLRTLNHIGMFSPALSEASIPDYDRLANVADRGAALEHRVRSYLDANCAHCHQPGGSPGFFDARFDTPLDQQRIVDGALANSFGDPAMRVVAPGRTEHSLMHIRMSSTDVVKMPPIARNVVDVQAESALREWINSLRPTEALPAGWRNQDLGSVVFAGAVSYAGGAFTVNGSGADIWGTADAGHFAYQPWTGDGEFIARVTSVQNTDPWAKAGVMIRETLSAGSRNAYMLLTPNNGVVFQYRNATNGPTDLSGGSYPTPPLWVRLVRSGNSFAGYWSADGAGWILIGSASIEMGPSIQVGLAVTSHNANNLCRATFDNVRFTGAFAAVPAAPTALSAAAVSTSQIDLAWTDNASNETGYRVERSTDGLAFAPLATVSAGVTRYSDAGLAPATTFSYRVRAAGTAGDSGYSNVAAATTPAGTGGTAPTWSGIDIGSVGVPGSQELSGTAATIRGSGADIWDSVDAFRFVYRPMSGDGFIEAEVTSLTNTHTWAKAGVMIRESLAANSANAFIFLSPANGLAVQQRSAAGGATTFTPGPWGLGLPCRVRLVRTGSTIVALASADGANWTTVATLTTAMGPAVYVGLAVTSHQNDTLATAAFQRINASGGSTATPPAAPTNLTATATSPSRIDLAWTDASTDESGFRIERSSDGTTFMPLGTVGPNVTAYADSGLTASTSYTYRVRATNGTGDSPYSNHATATTATASTGTPAAGTSWSGIDIGSVGVPGSQEWSGATATVRGSGADIWDTADAFRFVYRPLAGDGFVEAQVYSLSNTHSWAKAGVMIRDTLTPGSPNTFVFLTPSNGLAVQTRSAAGATTTSAAGPAEAGIPYWVRLERAGNTVFVFASANGFNWSTLATHPVSGSSAYVGLAVTSHQNDTATTAVFQQVKVSAGDGAVPLQPVAVSNLTATAASSSRIDLAWTDHASDETGFRIERSTGGAAFVQVAAVAANATSYADTGLAAATTYSYRVRASRSDGDSAYSNTATATTTSSAPAAPPAPAAPTNLTATAGSANRVDLTWSDNSTTEDGFKIERAMGGGSFAEIAVVGANATAYADATVSPSTTYAYRVRASSAAAGDSAYSNVVFATTASTPPPATGWQSQDVGAVAAAGSSSESGGTVTVIGSGSDIWHREDEFHFRHQPLTGDGEMICRVGSLTNTDGWAKAGLMFRETLAAGSRHVFMCVSASNGVALQYRTATGGESATSTGLPGGAPRWLRLVRSGGTFTGFASSDGSTWTQVGTVAIALPATVEAGLAVTSHNDGVRCTATFDNVAFRPAATAPPPPPPPPEPTWSFGDIGAVGRAGSNSSSGNTITISGSGADIWGPADAFRFVYRPLTGDGIVEAQVTSIQETHLWAKAGVMIRESLTAGSRNAFAFVTPSYHGLGAQARTATGGETANTAGPARNVPYWVRLTRSGNVIVAASSTDGVTWTTYATMTIEMGATAYFGFAVTSHDNAQLNTAVFTDPFVR